MRRGLVTKTSVSDTREPYRLVRGRAHYFVAVTEGGRGFIVGFLEGSPFGVGVIVVTER